MGTFIITIIAVIAILVIFILFSGIRIVQQATVKIVERLGKYHKTLTSGINIIIPFLDCNLRFYPDLLHNIQNQVFPVYYHGKDCAHQKELADALL